MTKTKIEWSEEVWNPVTGCTEVTPGCDHCYAKTFAERWRGVPGHAFERGFDVVLRPERFDQPLRWTKPRRIFVNSMSDLFHDQVPDEFIARVFATMARAPQHTFQLLTKRHGRMRSLLAGLDGSPHRLLEATTDEATALAIYEAEWPLPNVWVGVSVESHRWANVRIPALLDTPAAVRWISAEPLLGGVDLEWCGLVNTIAKDWIGGPGGGSGAPHPFLDWVVVGGESGPGARPMHPEWARKLRDQCTSEGVPFFFKQWGQHAPVADRPAVGDLWLSSIGATSAWKPGDGHIRNAGGDFVWPGTRTVLIRRHRSKHDAGRLLDGREWNEYPVGAPAVAA